MRRRKPIRPTAEITAFLARVDAYRAAHDVEDATISSVVFGPGDQIERLRKGADITTGRLRDASEAMSRLEAGGPRTRKPRNTKGASDGEHVEEARRD